MGDPFNFVQGRPELNRMGDFFNEQLESDDDSDAALTASSSRRRVTAGSDPGSDQGEGILTVDVYQDDDEIIIKSTIAGVGGDDIDIAITKDMVTIKGQRKFEEKVKNSDYYYQEIHWGSFSRSIILPEEVDPDKAKASMKSGLLTIHLPKISKNKTRRLKIGP